MDEERRSVITQEDMRIVRTPTGQQIVSVKDCDEPTRVMPLQTLKILVRELCPYTRSTVPGLLAQGKN